jgi:hypothetical protein
VYFSSLSILHGHFGIVHELVAQGADVYAVTVDDWTSLHSACKWNNTRVAFFFSMMQISVLRQKASCPPCYWGQRQRRYCTSFWWTVKSNQVWGKFGRNCIWYQQEDRYLSLPVWNWKDIQILHLSLNGSSNFLKFLNTSVSFVWDVRYSHNTKWVSNVIIQLFIGLYTVLPNKIGIAWSCCQNVFEHCLDASLMISVEFLSFY